MQPERPVQTTLAFHASRIVIDVGVVLAMASMSLPFVVSELGNRSAMHADAFPTMLLLLPIFVITLIPDHTRPIHPIAAWAALGFGLLALPYAIVKLLDAGILADTLDGSLGFGAYLLIIGVVTTIVGIGIGLYRNVRGLPAGGTPGRSAAYETRSAALRAPGTQQRRRRQGDPARPAPQQRSSSAETTTGDARHEPVEPAAPTRSAQPQPGIVFADEGAADREAEGADVPSATDTTAERADAAIDDHIMSMFDDEDPTESS